MRHARVLAFAGIALLLCGCSGWPRGAGFGLFDSTPPMPATASIELDSDPQGVEAKTSLGTSCRTPCTLEVPTSGGFSVTFSREGFTPQTVPVQANRARSHLRSSSRRTRSSPSSPPCRVPRRSRPRRSPPQWLRPRANASLLGAAGSPAAWPPWLTPLRAAS